MNILNTKINEQTDDFISRCEKLGVPNTSTIKETAYEAIRYYKNQKYDQEKMKELFALDQRWYDSLDAGTPDYSVYAPDIYLAHVWACWSVYSKKTVKDLCNTKLCEPGGVISLISPNSTIADLGCGLGYTTAALKQILPGSTVYGTNFPGTTQRKFAEQMGDEYGFKILNDTTENPFKVDVIFASEYFEHIEDPTQHLKDLCDKNDPQMFIMANAFGAKSHGHFNVYKNFGESVTNKEISRHFSKYLRSRGYKKVETKMWNARPAIWSK
jgi:2-polyprenyl-3-methyl-5-hydroxy-6-metoxy-1,4-benzoquinol methylase